MKLKKKNINRKVQGIKKFSDLSQTEIYWSNNEKTELLENQIIVPFSDFYSKSESISAIERMIWKFAEENFSQVSEHFAHYRAYATYITNNKKNEYQPQYNYEYFEKMYNEKNSYKSIKIEKCLLMNEIIDFSFINMEIVGYYDDSADSEKYFYASDSFFTDCKKTVAYETNYYKYIIVPLTKSLSTDIKYIDFSDKIFESDDFYYGLENITVRYLIENEVIYTVMNGEASMESTNKVITYISLGTLLLVIAFIGFYFSGVIIDKEKEVGILRSLGMSKKDITKIFLIETIIISLISLTISLIVSIIAMNIFNKYILEKYYLISPLYQFGIRQIGLIILVEIVVFTIGIILPLRKLMRKKPVDIIAMR